MKASRYAYTLILFLLAGYAYIALRGPRGLRGLLEKQDQIHQMEQRIADRQREIERKKEHIRRLESNPAEQELEIRERLKLVHPNEKVFIIGQPGKTR
jgi:cell division protein FtsB